MTHLLLGTLGRGHTRGLLETGSRRIFVALLTGDTSNTSSPLRLAHLESLWRLGSSSSSLGHVPVISTQASVLHTGHDDVVLVLA